MQWARYLYELGSLQGAYGAAAQYATQKGYDFVVYVPDRLPYFPFADAPFLALGQAGIEETTDPEEIFVALFFNEEGEEVERW